MKAALIFLFLAHSGLSVAGGVAKPVSCGLLLTEAECMQHSQTMTELTDLKALEVYVEQHLAMLREREVMCACTRERQSLARAQYR